MDQAKYEAFLNSGAVYVCGRASPGFQPIVVINVKLFTGCKESREHKVECAFFFFDWVVRELMVPGHIESWMVILDFKGVDLKAIPVKDLKSFVSAL